MKLLFRSLLLLYFLAAMPAMAQPGSNSRQGRMSQLENAKIAYITEKISLNQDQAQRFWPIYNEFTAKRRDLNRQMREIRNTNLDDMLDTQIKENLVKVLAMRQQEVNLEKEYFNKFQKVLNIEQVGRLYQAEQQFTRDVIKRVADRRGGPPAGGSTD